LAPNRDVRHLPREFRVLAAYEHESAKS